MNHLKFTWLPSVGRYIDPYKAMVSNEMIFSILKEIKTWPLTEGTKLLDKLIIGTTIQAATFNGRELLTFEFFQKIVVNMINFDVQTMVEEDIISMKYLYYYIKGCEEHKINLILYLHTNLHYKLMFGIFLSIFWIGNYQYVDKERELIQKRINAILTDKYEYSCVYREQLQNLFKLLVSYFMSCYGHFDQGKYSVKDLVETDWYDNLWGRLEKTESWYDKNTWNKCMKILTQKVCY